MKTQRILALAVLMLAPATAIYAQQTEPLHKPAIVTTQGDSTIIVKGTGDLRIKVYEEQTDGNRKKEEQIYEGVYLQRADAEERSFLDALPFIPKKRKHNSYEAHTSGLYVGFSNLSGNFLSFNENGQMPLDFSQSWEFGISLLTTSYNIRRNPHWGINAGISWGYRSFNLDGNYALIKTDGATIPSIGPDDPDAQPYYTQSRLRHFFFRVPIVAEWQQKLRGGDRFFINFGPEFEIRHSVKSFAHVEGGKKQTLSKGLYTRPVGVNLLVQMGYGDVGLYLRYSTYGFFQKDKGPEVMPYSFGLAVYL